MNTSEMNRQWTVAKRPVHDLDESHFSYKEVPIPVPQDGQILLKSHYLNLAPVMRMYMMKNGGGYGTEKDLAIGDVIHGRGVAEVMQSHHPDYKVGDFVQGQIGWQSYKVTSVSSQEKFTKMTPHDLPAFYGLSVLGMTGYSAYCGLISKGQPKKGDAVLVSGAAGGVGSLVIQMAKAVGCGRIIGIAGGTEKCTLVKDLGANEAIDYKSENVETQIKKLLPEGIDLFFDNVGGEILEAGMQNLRVNARVVLCGAISEYARETPFYIKDYGVVRNKNADLCGFFVYNHMHEFEQAEDDISSWIKAGELRPIVDIEDGFENMPKALMGMYSGTNVGKRIVRVTPGDDIIF